ncbi:MAG: rhodanese-like domain-containing protein [Candidatus Poseidonia sp.]|jgi:rhodanese-related sulfurtransferase|nr:sulfurtransferase [Euryarchaeota archaeon]MDP7393948.1 rhodanese-like domain-containing protein [Poseidonia sp.]MEC7098713.1 rhodanese-like domain-containing protein [Candidatus Thermoplasmatota archaeon]MEC8681195.1 rhodanese-like domain-containing protein [Candidatus Thermoplasmatota archaeon]|tara:strand:+ start:1301 stop:1678 length:378 start_codon:yes stop_codon:yes gene_type:complete
MAKKHNPRFLAIVEAARNEIAECEASDVRKMMDDGAPLVVVDVRERHEFEAGHLEGAVHIGKGVIERDVEKHDFADDARIVLYCGGGYRSAIAAKSLQDMGWTNVASLWGGWRGILAEGLPIWTP